MDPLESIITLLRPKTVLSKLVSGAGTWGVSFEKFGHPSFSLVLSGSCWLTLDGRPPAEVNEGDFVLLPTTPAFAISSGPEVEPVPLFFHPGEQHRSMVRHGDPDAEAEVLLMGGHFTFDPLNASLLTDHLPDLIRIRSSDPGSERVSRVLKLINDEARSDREGRDFILERLAEIMLLEALRSTSDDCSEKRAGLLAGLGDPQLAAALRIIHADVSQSVTVAELARHVGMSRSAFADRFARIVGVTPIAYQLQLRMAMAKDMLHREKLPLADVAESLGYQSASAFSTAFKRYTGTSPGLFSRN